MAQLKDVFEIEQARQTVEECLVIHLFQEGTLQTRIKEVYPLLQQRQN